MVLEKLNIPIIYLTAYADESTLSKAKVSEPFGYIIKPFKEIDLHTSIEMAIYKHEKESELKKERDFLYAIVENRENKDKRHIFVKSNTQMVNVDVKDINYVEALKDYVVINALNKRYTIHTTMKEVEERLPSAEFVRVHRSFIVRIDKILAIESSMIILNESSKEIPIGGLYKEDVEKKLNML